MSSDNIAIEFKGVWKKYSRSRIFHRSLREDISRIFSFKENDSRLLNNEFWALKRVNFQIHQGESIGLYGPNGSGKSTILKLIANITYPTQGSVSVTQSVAPLIVVGAGFHPDLSGRENIYVNGAILGMKIKEINQKIPAIIDFSGIAEFIDMPVKNYSAGMYLRLAFSVAIHSDADIYLFDEIIAEGDEDFQDRCIKKISELKRTRKTIIIVTHYRELMERLANKIYTLEKGELTPTV
ncbi:MAG: ABC transporter ATP-binding protein [Candidatus Omnitrophota bacterium]